MSKYKNILVTGAAGYFGSILTTKLIDEGYKVTGIDNLLFGSSSLSHLKNNKNFTLKKIDIQNSKEMKKAVKDQDAVVHLAGLVGDAVCSANPKHAVNINYLATKDLINISKKTSAQKFLFASTCSVYGFAEKLLTEDDSVNPVSVYGMAKVLAEQAVIEAASHNLCTASFRMSTLYGYSFRMRFDLVINAFTAQATFGDKISLYAGYQWRPFIHVADAANAYILALKADAKTINRQIFNLGDTRQNFKIFQIAEKVKKLILGSRVERDGKINEQRNYKIDSSKIERELKFKASISVDEGILEMYKRIAKSKKFRDYRESKFTSSYKFNE